MTSATDELRRLLDERGVEWCAGEDECDRKTHWESSGLTWEYFNDENGDAWLGFLGACESDVTPEQAIDATLGRGTCHRVMYKPTKTLVCSECGAGMPKQLDRYCYLHYCPNCGRKVTDG